MRCIDGERSQRTEEWEGKYKKLLQRKRGRLVEKDIEKQETTKKEMKMKRRK